jgi:cytochrome c-type biogenesis protein
MVPVYIASICGPDVFERKDKRNRLAIFLHSLFFVIGFTVVYVLMGAAAGLLGFAIGPHLAQLYKIAGGVLIFFGVFMLASLKIPALNFEKRLETPAAKTTGYLRSALTGAAFTIAWTACTAPILGSILALAGAEQTALRGAGLLAVYSLGLGLPFLVIGAALDTLTPVLRKIYRFSTIIYIVGGALLITFGILILLNMVNTWPRDWHNWVIWAFFVENLILLAKRFKWVTF